MAPRKTISTVKFGGCLGIIAAVAMLVSTQSVVGAEAAKPVSARPLYEVLPEDAFIIVSIPDITQARKDILASRLGKILDDSRFKPVFDEMRAFYKEQLSTGKLQKELLPVMMMLNALGIQPQDIAKLADGEVTVAVMDPPFVNNVQVPDIVIALNLHPNIIAAIRDAKTLTAKFGGPMAAAGVSILTEMTGTGLPINTLVAPIPQLNAWNLQISWTVIGNRLVLADRASLLKDVVAKMTAPLEPAGTFRKSAIVTRMLKALNGDPMAILRINVAKLQALKPFLQIQAPPLLPILDQLAKRGPREIVLGTAVDKDGLFRDVAIAGLDKGLKIGRPIAMEDRVMPPNGTIAFLQLNVDVQAIYKQVMETLQLSGPDGQRAIRDLQDIENELGVSLENDVVAALDGNAAAYVAWPYGSDNQPAHFLPDIIVKAKIRDKAAVARLMRFLIRANAKERDRFLPVEVDGLKGVSMRRGRVRLAEIEPTVLVDGDWIWFSLFSSQGIRRARQENRHGPAPITPKSAGVDKLVGPNTNTILLIDAASLLQFGYNLLDFAQHVDRMYPVLDFHTLPPEDVLGEYLAPIAFVSEEDEKYNVSVIVTPSGIPGGIAVSALTAHWFDKTRRMRRVQAQTETATQNLLTIMKRIQKYKADRGALPNTLRPLFVDTNEDLGLFFFAGVERNRWEVRREIRRNRKRGGERGKGKDNFERLHAYYYNPASAGNPDQVILTVKPEVLSGMAKQYPVITGDGAQKMFSKKDYQKIFGMKRPDRNAVKKNRRPMPQPMPEPEPEDF